MESEKADSTPEDGALAKLALGTIVADRYRLIDVLGQGGMSRVFKADDMLSPTMGSNGSPSIIAVKALSEEFSGRAGRFAALTAHVNRLRRLTHPNIVNLFGCERDGTIAFITMEFLSGESAYAKLHPQAVASFAPLSAGDARNIIAAIANALQYAHAQGVVHGDLKPGNLMLGPEYGAKLIDFGMVRWRAHAGAERAFPQGATRIYASPQLLAGAEPHATDDVFGLGCLAYELLTGVVPEKGIPPHLPALKQSEYEAVLHAVQPVLEQRTPSVRQFLAEFASPPLASPRRWPLIAGVAAVTVAAVLVISVLTQRRAHQSPTRIVDPGTPDAASLATATSPLPSVVAEPPPLPQPGALIHDCPTCPSMTVLSPGEFRQGAADEDGEATRLERPAHPVRIGYAFAMSTTDVTVDEFKPFIQATHRDMKGCDIYDGDWRHRSSATWQSPGFSQTAQHPVVCVSWDDAAAYAQWLSKATGSTYRLPTASEWEYAARAGNPAAQSLKPDPTLACSNANVADRSAERRYPGWQVFPCEDGWVYTSPVASFESNEFGLSDVIGNVQVWTQDCWAVNYVNASNDGTARTLPNCSEHEVRGSSWFSPPPVVRASYRNHFKSDYRTSSLGIRLVREMQP